MKILYYLENILFNKKKKFTEVENQIIEHQKYALGENASYHLKLVHFIANSILNYDEEIYIIDEFITTDEVVNLQNNINPNLKIHTIISDNLEPIFFSKRSYIFCNKYSEYLHEHIKNTFIESDFVKLFCSQTNDFYQSLEASMLVKNTHYFQFLSSEKSLSVLAKDPTKYKKNIPLENFSNFDSYKSIGNNNLIFCKGEIGKKSIVEFKGSNNTIFIENGANIKNTVLRIRGNNSVIYIGKKSNICGKFDIAGDNCLISIGENNIFTANTSRLFAQEDNSRIIIGNNCLIGEVIMRTSDSHSIVDIESQKRINHAKDILIGNKVWIAQGAFILKGVRIIDNIVVGACSIVSKSLLEENCIFAGTPAKKIRSGVQWLKERVID